MLRLLYSSCLCVLLLLETTLPADVKLPAIFSEHMVLQQGQPIPIWGWAAPGEQVTVTLAEKSQSATAGADGTWKIVLGSLPASGPHTLQVVGTNTVRRDDVLIGEVWICAGDRNMEFPLGQVRDADLEIAAAHYPRMRFMSVPHSASQTPRQDFEGAWQVCSEASVAEHSALGYYLARQLHQSLSQTPIGLIEQTWAESTCEAWIPQEALAADPKYQTLLARWRDLEQKPARSTAAASDPDAKPRTEMNDEGRRGGRQRRDAVENPADPLQGPQRPGNIYYGVVHPVAGYGIRGVIWWQGAANAVPGHPYRHLFPLLVQQWRNAWGQGDFPFYWVQSAACPNRAEPAQEIAWAELRESQSLALTQLPNTGEAVTIDFGDDSRIHPRYTLDVAHRVARWPLVRDYGLTMSYESPRFDSYQRVDNKIVIRFLGARDRSLAPRSPEGAEPQGFVISGNDRQFVPARARIAGGNRVEVWNESVPEPVAVRYAWVTKSPGNLVSRAGLPLTPFRTDDWPE